jgi:hypothetical protein
VVDRRLLTAFVAVALAGSSGCLGVHVGRVAGRVVDAETGKGIPGAELFRTYPLTQVQVIGEVGGRSGFTPDWTTSGANGEFEFPSRWVFQTGKIDHSPLIDWIHEDYGWGFVDIEKLDRSRLTIPIDRDAIRVEYLAALRQDITRGLLPCDNVRDDAHGHCTSLVDALRRASR